MKRRGRCWHCVALGLLASALVHGAAAGWWLSHRTTAGSLPQEHFETQLLALDLAAFGPDPSVPAAEPPGPQGPLPEPPTIASEPVQETEPPAVPEPPDSPPEEPETATGTIPEVPPPQPEEPPLPPVPEDTVQPEPDPQPESQGPAAPKPKPAPRHQVKRPIQPTNRPKRPPQRPQSHDAKTERAKKASPESQRPTRLAEANRPAARPQSTGGGSREPRASRGSGDIGASGSAAKAEASYLAELQRAIARHQRFPDDARRRNKTGIATLAFVVQGDGSIRQVRVAKTSGDASLDAAAVEAMKRLNRFKPIPPVIGRQAWSLRVPIRFDLR